MKLTCKVTYVQYSAGHIHWENTENKDLKLSFVYPGDYYGQVAITWDVTFS